VTASRITATNAISITNQSFPIPADTNTLRASGGQLYWFDNGSAFTGPVITSDTSESGTSDVRNIVVLSQASYDALGTKDNDTLYFIT
jgi:hypothetical protein